MSGEPDVTGTENLRGALRQHAETAKLLGVDFVPVAVDAIDADRGGEQPAERPEVRGDASEKASALEALRERHAVESPVVASMPGWNNIVFGDGDPGARVMFVGEAPGADEDEQGIPFVGRAGKKLTEMIIAMGLSRETVYITNVLKVRPPNNRTPTVDEASQEGPYLIEQIKIIQPEVIVTVGKPAANFLLGNSEAMGAMRGRWHECMGIPLMPTYHPAYLLRAYTPENRKKVWSDLTMVMDRLG